MSIEKEIKQYHNLHQLEKYKNYNEKINSRSTAEKQELADYISKHYNTMDEKEMKIIASKCLEMNTIKKILLSFELENYTNPTQEHMTLDEFIKQAKIIFNRYQCKAGGFNIEDNEWIVYRTGMSKHDIMTNEVLFVNTIATCDDEDDETNDYLEYILVRLNSISKNITVELREDHGKRNNHLLLWVTDTTENAVIGL